MSQNNQPSSATAFTLLAVASLTVMANATISASLPALGDHFSTVPGIRTLAGLVMTLPSLAVMLVAAFAGLLSDRIGRLPVMIGSMVLYGLAGASGAFVSSIEMILVGRLFLGIANAGVLTATQALIADLYQGPARERFTGMQGVAMSIGGILFLTSGGFLASIDWRAPFLIYLAALTLLPFVFLFLKEPQRSSKHAGPADAPFPLSFVIGIAALAAFSMMIFYMIPVKLPFYMRDLDVSSPALAGLAVASCTVTSAVTALLYSRIKARFSPQWIFAAAFGLMAIGYAVVGFAPNAMVAVGGVAFSGLGLGLTMPNQVVWMMSEVPPYARGKAAGILSTGIFLGQFVSPLVSGPIADVASLAMVYQVSAIALLGMAAYMAFRASAASAAH